MSHTIRDKQKLKARASKIQGQVVALKKMLDEPHECAAVLQQIAAIRASRRYGCPSGPRTAHPRCLSPGLHR